MKKTRTKSHNKTLASSESNARPTISYKNKNNKKYPYSKGSGCCRRHLATRMEGRKQEVPLLAATATNWGTPSCQMVSSLLWWVHIFVNLIMMESVPHQPRTPPIKKDERCKLWNQRCKTRSLCDSQREREQWKNTGSVEYSAYE